MVKLVILMVVVALLMGLFALGKFLFKVIDTMALKEKQKDVQHIAELNEETEEFLEKNADVVESASTNSFKEFVE